MKEIIKINKKELFTIPNMMGYFRLILIPVYLGLYFHANDARGYLIAAAVLGVSALTDCLDGKIARRFNMITEWGKILDPVADKLTHGAVALSLTFRYPLMRYVLMLFVIKELFMGIMGLVMMKRGSRMNGAQWYGKVCTAVLFVVLIVLLLDTDISFFMSGLLIWFCLAVMTFSLVCYIIFYIRMWRGVPNEENKISIKKCILVLIILILGLVVYDVTAVLTAYSSQPEITQEYVENFDLDSFYSEEESGERAAIIEDNGEALYERVRLINQAEESIIMSTFDFHSDESGLIMIGALRAAADRGVDVKLLVDGFDYYLSMEWNPYFYALSGHENVEMRVYNLANPLTPWKAMGRMHDKYLIADDKVYILGGRNTFNYFLGNYPGHKNYDRDVLVYHSENTADGSMEVLKAYFEQVWNYKECDIVHDNPDILEWICVSRSIKEIEEAYVEYCEVYPEVTETMDYTEITYPVHKISLITNPIEYQVKEPTAFYALAKLMENAEGEVKIHTPYIICNDMMYQAFSDICESGIEAAIMTNSVANNGNPFGAGDYSVNKEKILSTGMTVLEYEGGYSYHGKSIVIDDNISIVGSFNMDMRSAYLDTELMLVIDSEEINEMLRDEMAVYEACTRQALTNDQYLNENEIEPQELTTKRRIRMEVIQKLLGWARFLF